MIRPTTNYQEKPKLLTITDRNIGQCVKLNNEIIGFLITLLCTEILAGMSQFLYLGE